MNEYGLYNTLILNEEFEDKIKEIKNSNVWFDSEEAGYEGVISSEVENGVLKTINAISSVKLKGEEGVELIKKGLSFAAYDESFIKYNALSGFCLLISHCITFHTHDSWMPILYVDLNFYTKSKELIKKSKSVKYSESPDMEAKKDYLIQKADFIDKYAQPKHVLFIDGPILGGNVSGYTIKMVEKLHKKDIIPIFIVKNSNSSLVIDNIPEFKGKFNSDLHWANSFLKEGERTNYFYYQESINKTHNKVFSYIRPFKNMSVQRVELYSKTYEKYAENIDQIFNLIFYLFVVSATQNNPQIRPIIISEMYARETLKKFPFRKVLHDIGLTETTNQTRFGG